MCALVTLNVMGVCVFIIIPFTFPVPCCQVLATPVAGNLLDYFQSRSIDGLPPQHTYGYTLIFLVAVIYFASGTFFVKYLDSVH